MLSKIICKKCYNAMMNEGESADEWEDVWGKHEDRAWNSGYLICDCLDDTEIDDADEFIENGRIPKNCRHKLEQATHHTLYPYDEKPNDLFPDLKRWLFSR